MNVIVTSVVNLFNSLPQDLKQTTLEKLNLSVSKDVKLISKQNTSKTNKNIPNVAEMKADFTYNFNQQLKTRGT